MKLIDLRVICTIVLFAALGTPQDSCILSWTIKKGSSDWNLPSTAMKLLTHALICSKNVYICSIWSGIGRHWRGTNAIQFIKAYAWPEHILHVRNKLLFTTLIEEDTGISRGKDSDLLDSLIGTLSRTYPVLALSLDSEQHNSCTTARSSISTTSEESSDKCFEQVELRQCFQIDENKKRRQRTACEAADHTLVNCISSLAICRKSPSSGEFDLTSSSFSYGPDSSKCPSDQHGEHKRKGIVQEFDWEDWNLFTTFCKSFWKFDLMRLQLILQALLHFEGNRKFEAEGFVMIQYLYHIISDPSTIQQQYTTHFPQRKGENVLISETPGMSAHGFLDELNSVDNEKRRNALNRWWESFERGCAQQWPFPYSII